MNRPPEKRDARRVILPGPPHLRFHAGGQGFENIPMANLSHGGCLALVPSIQAGVFRSDLVIEDLVILHPGVFANPIKARVAWIMGAKDDTAAVGLQFLEMSSETRISLVSAVDAEIIGRIEER
ncbi:MAG TPA: PilZ domain-containing protein [Holophagaceae bacterium]|nr:PilZ domain-containing protein [Holophagaceae bacterium]